MDQAIYVCNVCGHMWQDAAQVQCCEGCGARNQNENIYSFEVYAADYAADWHRRVQEALGTTAP